MGTFTAQILIGQPHLYHDGIAPSHILFLSENSRSAWILSKSTVSQFDTTPERDRIWIPTVEHMLEDALLMIAVFVCEHAGIHSRLHEMNISFQDLHFSLYEQTTEAQRLQLYEYCKKIKNFPKVIVSTFQGSSITNQVSVLDHYQMDYEVCLSDRHRFSR